MPQMGTSVAEGTVVSWAVEVGAAVTADQVICEISTDKVDSEVPAPAGGVLAEIVVAVGETVDVGTVLARIAAAHGAPAAAPAGPAVGADDPAGEPRESSSAAPPAGSAAVADAGGPDGRRYSPVVQRVAAQHAVDLSLVAGTGRGGRVTKKDVLAHVAAGGNGAGPEERPLHTESPYRPDPVPAAAAPAAPSVPDDLGGAAEPLSRMRQSIGGAMTRSLQTAATCTTIVECDVSAIERRRRELGLTALPLIARATIETLREFPDLNATLDGATVTRYERVHLGIAVSLGDDGLIVPVVHDAHELSPEGLGARIRELAKRARAKQLAPDDVQGATFTITNPGQFGALIATPVIPLPQVAILDLEAIVKRPVVVADADGHDAIAIRPMVNLCMSWDHRALDGVYAAQFLTALRRRVEA
ncbi:MAG TPA: dihydrolipoamide acetyltransferase family protein [Conexibacter sp.]|nr:dihydrolipoamide acetyltransferase family protein [Conexibacter sp.]